MLKGLKGWVRFFLWPSLPYQILEVVYPDRIETYYEGYDEIRIYSSRRGYTITVIPHESRSNAPGPISFVSSHDPWTVGALVTPFYVYRGLVITWAVIWFSLIYFLIFYVVNFLFMPPTIEANVPPYGKIAIPDPLWRPDPVMQAFWIVGIGFLVMYYVFHILRFVQPTVKYSTLITIGSVSGVHYTIPAPEPLTTVKTSDFLRLLGYKIRHFELETVHTLMGALTSIIRENKALREQALSYDDAMSRVAQIDTMLKRFSSTQVVTRFMMTKPLLFMLLITIPLVVGVILGMALGGGVSIEQPPAP